MGAIADLGALRRAEIAIVSGLVVTAAVVLFLPWQATALVGWDSATLLFLFMVWIAVAPMDSHETENHAVREDSNQALAGSIIVGAAIFSLVAIALILVRASNSSGTAKALLIGEGIVSIILSWAAVHTVFTLRYARLYYSGKDGGVDFNEDDPPVYKDFAYLSFTIGMTFQVSDTDLTTKPIRHTALSHALVSYVFGAMIIGLVINVVGGLVH